MARIRVLVEQIAPALTIVVDSGNGYQAFYCAPAPYAPDMPYVVVGVESPAAWPTVETEGRARAVVSQRAPLQPAAGWRSSGTCQIG